ncbi:MAG: hypothetical protein ACK5LJ_00855 [Paracoccus sp. (in: a-proteobacteria)]
MGQDRAKIPASVQQLLRCHGNDHRAQPGGGAGAEPEPWLYAVSGKPGAALRSNGQDCATEQDACTSDQLLRRGVQPRQDKGKDQGQLP